MAGIMEEMVTFLKRTYVRTVVFSGPDPMTGHCHLTTLLVTPGHSQVSLAQSLVGSLLFSSGAHKVFLCLPRVFFPSPMEVLQSNSTGIQSQIPWGFSVPFPDP